MEPRCDGGEEIESMKEFREKCPVELRGETEGKIDRVRPKLSGAMARNIIDVADGYSSKGGSKNNQSERSPRSVKSRIDEHFESADYGQERSSPRYHRNDSYDSSG